MSVSTWNINPAGLCMVQDSNMQIILWKIGIVLDWQQNIGCCRLGV
jgi:hypothetical protein